MRRIRIPVQLLAVTGVLALVLAACGGDGGGAAIGGEGDKSTPITLAFSAAVPQVQKIPAIQALDALKADGYTAEPLFMQKSEDPPPAVVRGDANFGSASATAVLAAIGRGLPLVALLQSNVPDYALVAPTSVSDPGGLDGLRVGIHAKVSSTALYTQIALQDFPDVEPKLLVVPGSANRIRALAEGELDASVVQLADLPDLEKLAPGKFHVIFNVATERPDLVDTVLFTHNDTLANDPDLVKAVVRAFVEQARAAYTDTDALAAAIAGNVPETTPEQADELSQIYTEAEVWPKDGGLSEAGVTATVEALASSGLLEQPPDPAEVADRGVLEEVLQELG